MVQIIKGYPPNYDEIVKVFPLAADRSLGVIFAYDEAIYNPSGNPLPPELIAHEVVHLARQKILGVGLWWEKYLTDTKFRYYEELLAHRAEYRKMAEMAPGRPQRRRALAHVARKLAQPLYGRMVTAEKAKEHILMDGMPTVH